MDVNKLLYLKEFMEMSLHIPVKDRISFSLDIRSVSSEAVWDACRKYLDIYKERGDCE